MKLKTFLFLTAAMALFQGDIGVAQTPVKDEILDRCNKILSEFLEKGGPNFRYYKHARLNQLELFHQGYGPFTPLAENIFNNPATKTAHINTETETDYLRETKYFNWQSFKGEKVAVRFKGIDTVNAVEQLVFDIENLDLNERSTLQKLLSETFVSDTKDANKAPAFVQSGLFIVKTNQKSYVTNVFHSKSERDIDFRLAHREIKTFLKSINLQKSEEIVEITFLHSHKGRGTPLDEKDNEFASQLNETKLSPYKVRVLAAPAGDNGNVLFGIFKN